MTTESTRRTSHGMRTQLVTTAADVISRAMQQGRTLPAALAVALDSAQLLQSPDTAAEHEKLHAERNEFCDRVDTLTAVAKGNKRHVQEMYADLQKAQARVAELEADREANDREYEQATARIAALENERHTTNEALSDAAEQLRKNRDQITALETQREWRRAHLVALQNDALNIRGALSPNGEARKVPFELGQTLLPAVEWLIARVSELEAAQGTVYRAAHDSIVMGLYRTATEARAHCVAEERRTWAKHETPVFDWIEDEEDSVAELVIVDEDGDVGSLTGYVVTALEVAAEYDEEADQ